MAWGEKHLCHPYLHPQEARALLLPTLGPLQPRLLRPHLQLPGQVLVLAGQKEDQHKTGVLRGLLPGPLGQVLSGCRFFFW